MINTINKVHEWRQKTDAVAAVESMFVFPVLMTLLFGVVDIGTGVVINTKVISAAQIASDLLTRQNSVNDEDLEQARLAAQTALIPYYNADDFGLDIVGIRYEGEEAVSREKWRETYNMSPNENVLNLSDGLGLEGDGVVIVTVEYRYHPRFSDFLTGDIVMREIAVVKGRDTPYVERL